jgi:hypothetical protein
LTLGHMCTLQAPSFSNLSPIFGRLPPPRHWAAPPAPYVKRTTQDRLRPIIGRWRLVNLVNAF